MAGGREDQDVLSCKTEELVQNTIIFEGKVWMLLKDEISVHLYHAGLKVKYLRADTL